METPLHLYRTFNIMEGYSEPFAVCDKHRSKMYVPEGKVLHKEVGSADGFTCKFCEFETIQRERKKGPRT